MDAMRRAVLRAAGTLLLTVCAGCLLPTSGAAEEAPVYLGSSGELVYNDYANVLFSALFDTEETGLAPGGWTVTETGSGSMARVADYPDNRNKSLQLYVPTSSDAVEAVRGFRAQDGAVRAVWRLYDAGAGGASIRLGDGAADAVALSLLPGGGTPSIAYETDAGWQTLQSYSRDAWLTVELVADTGSGTFDLAIDGVTAGTGLPMLHTVSELTQIQFALAQTNGGDVYVDDLRVDEAYAGNRLIDYSHAGYGGGGTAIPDIAVMQQLEPAPGDNAARIQEAIDDVSALAPDGNGFRGAVLLKRGVYEVSRSLHLHTDGVVLRGEGQGSDGTVLRFTSERQQNLIVADAEDAPEVQAAALLDSSGAEPSLDETRTYYRMQDLRDGDWLQVYAHNRLDDKSFLQLRYASDTAATDGVIEVRRDSPTGTVIGSADLAPTGAWDRWVSLNIPLTAATGNADVYVTFASGSNEELANVRSLRLLRDTIRREAEQFDAQSGTAISQGGSGSYVSGIADGNWLAYEDVDMTGRVNANLTFQSTGSPDEVRVEIRKDSPTGEVLGQGLTSGQSANWRNVIIPLKSTAGVHDLYLVFHSEATATDLLGLDYFSLGGSVYGELPGTRQPLIESYVPTGAVAFDVQDGSGYQVGDAVVVLQQFNEAWADDLGMGSDAEDTWDGNYYVYEFARKIVGVSGNRITVDLPLIHPIQAAHSAGYLYKRDSTGLARVGVERLRLVSSFEGATDENHGFYGIAYKGVVHGWIRNVTAKYFVKGLASLTDTSYVTVQDSADLAPRSIVVGGRRYPFFLYGKSAYNLVQRAYAEDGRHSFGTSARVTGPNVFLDSVAVQSREDSGPHNNYAIGTLYDNVTGGTLRVWKRPSEHGWSGAQHVLWNVTGAGGVSWLGRPGEIKLDSAPGSKSFAIGAIGELNGPGPWVSPGQPVLPRSLYLQQLKERLGQSAVEAVTAHGQADGSIHEWLMAWRGGLDADYPEIADGEVEEHFEGLPVGALPPDWGWGGTAPVIEQAPSPGSRSLRIGTGDRQFSLSRLFAPQAGRMTAEWRMMLPSADRYMFIHVGNANFEHALTLTLGSNYLSYTTLEGTSQRLQNIESNRWYSIRLEIDVLSQLYHIYVDDMLLIADIPFLSPLRELDSIVYQASSGSPDVLYLDDVQIAASSLRFRSAMDGETIGAQPQGWSIVEQPDTSGRIAPVPYVHDASLLFADDNDNGAVSAVVDLAPLTGRFGTKWRFMDADGGKWFYFRLRSGVTEAVTITTQLVGGEPALMVQDAAGAWQLIDAYEPGRWYELRIVGDPAVGTFDVYVDGERKIDGMAFRNPIASWDNLYFKSSHSFAGTTLYVDSVQVDDAPRSVVTTLVNSDFDDEALDTVPRGWAVSATGGASGMVKPVPDASDRSVALSDYTSSGDVRLSRAFGPQEGDLTAEWSFMDADTGKFTYMQLNSGTTAGIRLHTRTNGSTYDLVYVDSDGVQQWVQSYNLNTWYTVKLVVRPFAQAYDLYVDGQLKAADVPFTNTSVTTVDNVYVKTATTGGNTTVYIDNVRIERGN
ncbi:carbohydrate-binding protein [Paenibacillus sp. IB182496]|uniref:Carbohydrate-binding protein n=1 Tax=Paenibacillus sabuli TaxID=2772509 RepID=A0A927BXY3_9BACL|nr:carbohydrate-binding protein [Paenibacillus sabuli]MBD2847449.1 carbohydrate-binding protein [Paenibacillus sabuli]